MAKKIVRGITDVKTINNQDFDTNNVNDLLSDGQYNYIHRKKGKSEEYHNLTDNIKTISSDNTDLLTVANNNKTNNTATLSPKHDSQKEQVLESERNTVNIRHATNATPEKTKVDTNPQKVLEHSNLQGNTDFVKIQHTDGQETTLINSEKITEKFNNVDSTLLSKQNRLTAMGGISINGDSILLTTLDLYTGDLNNLTYNCQAKPVPNTPNLPTGVYGHGILTVSRIGDVVSQQYHTFDNMIYFRSCRYGDSRPQWTPWKEMAVNNSLRQLYTNKQTYSEDGWLLKTYVRYVSSTASVDTLEEEFNFILNPNINNATRATFTLNEHDKTKFNNIMTTYGTGDNIKINGYIFVLVGDTLTVTSGGPSVDYVTSFSDII